mgnify:CR=1 FL=1
MKWGLKSLRSRKRDEQVELYVKLQIMEARLERLLEILEYKEIKAYD